VVFELEYCSGPEVSSYMKRYGPIPEREAKIIIKQVLCALNYLYGLKEKVIHYDLKPSNIMFDQGVIKIVDFGLCKVMEESDDTRIELTSQGVGTYYYLPPETFEDCAPKISSKVDIWSVGVIFYEMLFGKRPFGHGMSQNQIMQNGTILKAFKIDYPQDKKVKVSDLAKEFIEACLCYNPDNRMNPSQAYEHPYLKKLN
jgi:tousled-like kinase